VFTQIAACTLAESLDDPPLEGSSVFVISSHPFDCHRMERSSFRAGLVLYSISRVDDLFQLKACIRVD
jgi:hypothetical protein